MCTSNSIFSSVALFNKECEIIKDNRYMTYNTQKDYESKRLHLDNIHYKTVSQLNEWKKDKVSSLQKESLEVDPAILKKANMIRTGLKVAKYAALILGIIAGLTLVALSLTFGVHAFIQASTSICAALMHQAFVFSIPLSVIILTGSTIVTGALAIASRIGKSILNHSEILLEERAIKDRNFQDFVEKFLEKEAKFFPTKEDLKDRQLHHIFIQWETSMKGWERSLSKC